MYGDHMDGTDWAAMGIWMVFLVVLVAVIIWAFTHSARIDRSTETPTKSALEILDERFARGEIDTDEYQDRRRTLGRPPAQ